MLAVYLINKVIRRSETPGRWNSTNQRVLLKFWIYKLMTNITQVLNR